MYGRRRGWTTVYYIGGSGGIMAKFEARAYVEVEAESLEKSKEIAEVAYQDTELKVIGRREYIYAHDENGEFIKEI